MDVSPLDQIKIQAQVLIPLVKALREEMGEEKANDLVRGVLGDLYRVTIAQLGPLLPYLLLVLMLIFRPTGLYGTREA